MNWNARRMYCKNGHWVPKARLLCGERPGINAEVIDRLREVLTRAVLDQINEGAELRIGAGSSPFGP